MRQSLVIIKLLPQRQRKTTKASDSSNGIRSNIKTAIDSHESFMNEYVDYMKKRKANPTNASLIK